MNWQVHVIPSAVGGWHHRPAVAAGEAPAKGITSRSDGTTLVDWLQAAAKCVEHVRLG